MTGWTEGKPIQSSYSWLGGLAGFGLVLIVGTYIAGLVFKLLGWFP